MTLEEWQKQTSEQSSFQNEDHVINDEEGGLPHIKRIEVIADQSIHTNRAPNGHPVA